MKYLVILADGMADFPVPELNGQTPMEVSKKPNIDFLAQNGTVGIAKTVPVGMPPGSDVANLAVMGYDPHVYYTGRSPLEAVSIGVELGKNDVAFRCNLVTLSDEAGYRDKTMVDYSSDEISTAEAAILINDIAERFRSEIIQFYSGVSYRHLMVWRGGPEKTNLTPPHDISDRPIAKYLPAGEGEVELLRLMTESVSVLKDHPVNQARIQRGLRPATSLWFWGQGTKPSITSFFEKYQLKGSVISAVDLAKGLGICAGLDVIEVPGATGNIHTNFKGKAEAALAAFKAGQDFVYLHVEAPDEAGHRGEIENKVLAIEKIDQEILGPILSRLPEIASDFKVLVMPDHPTPLTLKTHVADPVPFVIYQHLKKAGQYSIEVLTEQTAAATGLVINEGYRLMDRFILG